MKLHGTKRPPGQQLMNIMELNTSIEKLDNDLTGIERSVQTLFDQSTGVNRALEAVIELVGEKAVYEKMAEIRIRAIENDAHNSLALTEDRVKKGELQATESVGETGVVTLAFSCDDGTQHHPARSSYSIEELLPKMREAVVGQAVGTKVGIPDKDGYHAEIVGAYSVVAPVLVPTPMPLPTPAEPVATA